MRTSKFERLKVGMVTALLCGTGAVASSGAPPAPLTAGQIFETMLENYATLYSYSDRGQIITTMDGTVITTPFTTRLERPGFYRLEWEESSQTPFRADDSGLVGAWSFGVASYMQLQSGLRMRYERDVALADVASSSGGTVVTIPMIFFHARGVTGPGKLIGPERMPDAKVGKTDCYVIAGQMASGETKAFWIGKDDFLIYQVCTRVTPQVMQSSLMGLTGHDWQTGFHGSSSTETYTNIVVDKKFTTADFDPTFPLFTQSQ